MNRRHFLAGLAAFASTAVLEPEQLLWRPGAKRIFLPSLRPREFSATLKDDVTLTLDTTWDELRLGDVFTIEGHYIVNPPGVRELQRFTITHVGVRG